MSAEDEIIAGAVVADQAAAEAAEAQKRARRKRPTKFPSPTPDGVCSNCGTELSGPVCHSCGQSADEFHRPIWQLVSEIADGLFGFEGRLWRTVPAIVFRPGYVTRRYLGGVRMRYVQPFRLYLAASVLFFLVAFFGQQGPQFGADTDGLSALDPSVNEEMAGGLDRAREELRSSGVDPETAAEVERTLDLMAAGALQVEDPRDSMSPSERAVFDRMQQEENIQEMRCSLVPEDCPEPAAEADPDAPGAPAIEVDESDNWNISGFEELPVEARRFLADRIELAIRDPGRFFDEMQARAPQVMFFLLPIFALLLAVTHFWKRGLFFYDHMIVSLHFHSFIFFFLTLLIILGAVLPGELLVLAFIIWSNFYLYRLHRRVYQCGRFTSVLRTLFVDFVYFLILSVAMLIWMLVVFLLA